MQAELFGFRDGREGGKRGGGRTFGVILETSAAFSSRYRAEPMTPGIRARPLRRADFDDAVMREIVERESPDLDWATLKPGDLVPLSGGEVFVCLGHDGRPVRINADINAAQSLQRRFWTQHRDAFRLPVRRVTVGDRALWVPPRLGKRAIGALGGHGWLVATGHASGSCRWEPTSAVAWRRVAGQRGIETDVELDDDDEWNEGSVEVSTDVSVFFRDPSGIVMPDRLWYPSAAFWSIVKAKTAGALRAQQVDLVGHQP